MSHLCVTEGCCLPKPQNSWGDGWTLISEGFSQMQLSDLRVLITKFLSSTPKFNQQMPLHSCGPGEQALGISPIVQVELFQPVPPARRWVGVPSLFLPCHSPWRCLLLLRWQARRGQTPELPRAQPPCFFHLLCQAHVVHEPGWTQSCWNSKPGGCLIQAGGLVLALRVPAVPGKPSAVDRFLAFPWNF